MARHRRWVAVGVAAHRARCGLPQRRLQQVGLRQLPHPERRFAGRVRPAAGALPVAERRDRNRRVLGAEGPVAHRHRQRGRRRRRSCRAREGTRRRDRARSPDREPPEGIGELRRQPATERGTGRARGRGQPPTAALEERPHRLHDGHVRRVAQRPDRRVPGQPRRVCGRLRESLLRAPERGRRAAPEQPAHRDRRTRREHVEPAGVVVGQPRRRGRSPARRDPAPARVRIGLGHGDPDRGRAARRDHRRRPRVPLRRLRHGVVGRAAGDADDRPRRGPRLLPAHRHALPPARPRRAVDGGSRRTRARLGRQGVDVRGR